jgi:hypothetical protein
VVAVDPPLSYEQLAAVVAAQAERLRKAEQDAEKLSSQLRRDLRWIVRDGERAKTTCSKPIFAVGILVVAVVVFAVWKIHPFNVAISVPTVGACGCIRTIRTPPLAQTGYSCWRPTHMMPMVVTVVSARCSSRQIGMVGTFFAPTPHYRTETAATHVPGT